MHSKTTILIAALAALLLTCGCARRVPLSDLSSGGAVVGVVARTAGGEEIRGELLAVTERDMFVLASYTEGGGVDIEGFGDGRRVIVDGERVDGEVVRVDRLEGARVARVRRTLAIQGIERATFHRSGEEVSLASLLSLLLGPSIGGLLALAF